MTPQAASVSLNLFIVLSSGREKNTCILHSIISRPKVKKNIDPPGKDLH